MPIKTTFAAVTRFVAHVTRSPLGMAGAIITTVSAMLFLTLFAVEQVGFHGGPYLGIIAFLILPALLVLGLVLMPVGLWRDRQRRRREQQGQGLPELPVWDLNSDRTRRNFLVFVALTAVNLMIVSVATYKGVDVMDSTPFCGATCHSVMRPEYTTYKRSPHAHVACVKCHIGPGANWFVKSKLSGSWQVVAVAFNLYPRPIPVPVENLRPARETCEECHWPNKFVGDRLKVISHFSDDEANSSLKTVLVLKVGGRQVGGSQGIHWHVDPDHTVRYRSDEKRETVYEVEMTQKGAPTQRFLGPAARGPEATTAAPRATVWRTMDCVDCHNRPTHIYRQPEDEIDAALLEKRIDPALPFVRREGLKALKVDYPSQEAARSEIMKAIAGFYRQSYPQAAVEAVAAAGRELGDIYCQNVFPSMNVRWGTYVNHIGHMSTPGCFRCHDDEHKTADGKAISQDCTICHSILAQEEKDAAVLKTLLD
jgi:nitrate/TMAO reductase-like tetraheme cytochrome c subunit